ncbi:hypothetical protein AQUCO_02400010v1 [Aquilegia coerulea]|uniref:Uncharacterized protein n=1 Tax=Aquilegia coerulea TaxID=218851 RepID=A0A2G5DAY8_AQUCA|nr:hypothetical protein AQUCO_02400010v1 [Aquilegia coerulea]
MPRNDLIEEKCKIRKRGCSSSSASSSSMLQNYRFKRVVLINKRGGSSTPVPRWRMSSRSPASILKMPESPNQKSGNGGGGIGKGKQVPVSARKLAASLWEMNQMNSPGIKENYEEKRVKKETRNRERVARSVQSGYLPQHLSDPSHSPVSEKIRHGGHKMGGFDSVSNTSYMEIETRSRRPTPTASTIGAKTHLKDLKNTLTTSNELLKIVSRMWGIEEHYSSGKSLVSALRTELERASEHVDQIIHEQHSDHKEINYLVKNFTEEKAAWKKKMHEKVESAIKSISSDLEMEKKLRKRTESLNKTLGRELAETKGTLANVVKELQSEKRARDVMEQVCEELASSVGEDRALVEKLKKESEKVREEVEKEREMLQLADVLREERVQMKLLEAKYQFEEKNAAVEKLRSELEAFLRTKESKQNNGGSHSDDGRVEVGSHLMNSVASYQNHEIGRGKGEIEDREGCKDIEPEDASTESDLHSIELNVDNNNRNYMWNYTTGTAQEDQKRRSVDKETKGRKSTSEKIARGRASLERCTSDGIEWDFSAENHSNWGYGYDQGAYSKNEKKVHGEDVEIESQRHKSIKDLRDYIMSNSRLASAHGFASPKKQWVES